MSWSEDDQAWVAESRAILGAIGFGETPPDAVRWAMLAERLNHMPRVKPYCEPVQAKGVILMKGRRAVGWKELRA